MRRSQAAIAELVSTPQFRQQVALMGHALATGQLDTSHFSLPGGQGYGVAQFLAAIQRQGDEARAANEGGGGGGGGDAGPGQP